MLLEGQNCLLVNSDVRDIFMPGKFQYSIEKRIQACKDYQSGTGSLEEICILLGTPRKNTIME